MRSGARFSERSSAKRHAVGAALSLLGATAADTAVGQEVLRGLEPPPRRVVFLAGGDDSHPDGTHEYLKAAILLADALERSSVGPRLTCELHHHGWPQDDAVIAQADTIVLLSAGADQRREEHPFLVGERLAVVERAMRRGCGLVVIHWGLFVPQSAALAGEGADRDIGSPAECMQRWIGGYFDYQSGPEPRRWASRIETGEYSLEPVLLDQDGNRHPILHGIERLTVADEFYLDLRFPPREQRDALEFHPLLVAQAVPEHERRSMHSGPAPGKPPDPARCADTVAFCIERADGGRGVGFSGGHFLEHYGADRYQPLLLNAIAWTAKLPIPATGIEPPDRPSPVSSATTAHRHLPASILILTGHDHPAHDWRGVSEAMRELLARDPRLRVEVSEQGRFGELPVRWRSTRSDAAPPLAAVILAGNHWDQPAVDAAARAALLEHVAQGGGLVLPHFAGSGFQASLPAGPDSDWPEFRERLAARWWRYDAPASGHEPFGPFRVELAAERHPITAGAVPWLAHDELYFAQAGTLPIAPLITARSPTTGRYEPLAWVREVGAGRVFQSLLGHAPESYRDPGTARLFVRGVQWAARLVPFDVAGLAPDPSATGGAATGGAAGAPA
ncbi:MAG: ThuA domain-containing protein, partial [Planctomycetes bacterium]|nr:ThuA domain-containing protein [Planctomycetota bacterium]